MALALQQSGSVSCLQSRQRSSTRSSVLARPAPLSGSSSTSRARTVQVCAKGKGRRTQLPTAPAGEMVKPQMPPVDPDNEQFCVFTRATTGTYQNWIFVSVVTGGSAANAMVKGLQTEWGRTLYTRSVMSSIGQSVYKDRDNIIGSIKKQVRTMMQYSQMAPGARLMEPILNQPTSSFEFAFKIRDRTKPGDFQKPEGLTILPTEAQLAVLPIQQFQKFFSPDTLGALFKGSS